MAEKTTEKKSESVAEKTTDKSGAYYVLAREIGVGGVFRSRKRGHQLTAPEVIRLREKKNGSSNMLDVLIKAGKIGKTKPE